jgi:hypothetical protein
MAFFLGPALLSRHLKMKISYVKARAKRATGVWVPAPQKTVGRRHESPSEASHGGSGGLVPRKKTMHTKAITYESPSEASHGGFGGLAPQEEHHEGPSEEVWWFILIIEYI